ncbi:MAG: response regulator transcription factor [Anaerolineae bacterium]|nr:response regulator transcription factor [Anaerolineae bacterium]
MTSEGKILVVDDEAAVRFFLKETLTREGYEVVTVESGEAALARISEEHFDLALIDLKLNGIGGMEVLTQLRQQAPQTAAIVLTAYASLETAVVALRHGAHDYLFKPCKIDELRKSVRTALASSSEEAAAAASPPKKIDATPPQGTQAVSQLNTPPPPVATHPPDPAPAVEKSSNILRWGDLVIDFIRHTVTLDGEIVDFSPTEFDLLAYLVTQAPRVVSPQELTREVQGYESESWEARNTARFHIYHIRQKIKSATGRADVIRTIRGVGYAIGE